MRIVSEARVVSTELAAALAVGGVMLAGTVANCVGTGTSLTPVPFGASPVAGCVIAGVVGDEKNIDG